MIHTKAAASTLKHSTILVLCLALQAQSAHMKSSACSTMVMAHDFKRGDRVKIRDLGDFALFSGATGKVVDIGEMITVEFDNTHDSEIRRLTFSKERLTLLETLEETTEQVAPKAPKPEKTTGAVMNRLSAPQPKPKISQPSLSGGGILSTDDDMKTVEEMTHKFEVGNRVVVNENSLFGSKSKGTVIGILEDVDMVNVKLDSGEDPIFVTRHLDKLPVNQYGYDYSGVHKFNNGEKVRFLHDESGTTAEVASQGQGYKVLITKEDMQKWGLTPNRDIIYTQVKNFESTGRGRGRIKMTTPQKEDLTVEADIEYRVYWVGNFTGEYTPETSIKRGSKAGYWIPESELKR